MKSDIELIREAAEIVFPEGARNMEHRMNVAMELRALADRMEKAEPVAEIVAAGVFGLPQVKFLTLPERHLHLIGSKLYACPVSDEVERLKAERDREIRWASHCEQKASELEAEVERLKAEREAHSRDADRFMLKIASLEAQLSAIRQAVKKIIAHSHTDPHERRVMSGAVWLDFINTINQQ